ncbi:endonuclease/exonuclease/phosphatase family protein [Candidatus Saccharibacteria bacterium]|nr:endonuclease/exonuclease/phosphatase family protein [Candidatus Saccharibacteria bacterium]
MKLMTLNVWQGRLERVLLKHLEQQNFDFACMQEAVDYGGKTGGIISSYSTIGKSLRLDHQFFSPLNATKFGKNEISFGNVIYSKLPFTLSENTFTRGSYKADFDFDEDDYNIRALQHVALGVEGKKLHILNHHGHHIDAHKLGDDETLRQTSMIIDYIKKLDGAVILCGDFNLSPESESIKQFDSVLKNLSVDYSLETTRSLLTYKNEVCDYIFVNDEVDIQDFSMDQTIISDHNALILDFELK